MLLQALPPAPTGANAVSSPGPPDPRDGALAFARRHEGSVGLRRLRAGASASFHADPRRAWAVAARPRPGTGRVVLPGRRWRRATLSRSSWAAALGLSAARTLTRSPRPLGSRRSPALCGPPAGDGRHSSGGDRDRSPNRGPAAPRHPASRRRGQTAGPRGGLPLALLTGPPTSGRRLAGPALGFLLPPAADSSRCLHLHLRLQWDRPRSSRALRVRWEPLGSLPRETILRLGIKTH